MSSFHPYTNPPPDDEAARYRKEDEDLVREVNAAALAEIRRQLSVLFESADFKVQPTDGDYVRMMARKSAQVARDQTAFSDSELPEKDPVGDPAVPLDNDCARQMYKVCLRYSAMFYAEDDRLRGTYKEAAPAVRAEGIRNAGAARQRIVIADPLDGSHQCIAMNQPGGYGPASMTVSPAGTIAVGVSIGTGETLIAGLSPREGGDRVTRYDLLAWQGADEGRVLRGDEVDWRRHYKETWILPGYKKKSMQHAVRILNSAERLLPKKNHPLLTSPLGGNPGILSSMVLAQGGAVAAYQPNSWGWDQFMFVIVAALGMPVADVESGEFHTAWSLANRLLQDLSSGTKSPPIVAGKTHQDLDAIRSAVLDSGVLSEWAEEDAQREATAKKI